MAAKLVQAQCQCVRANVARHGPSARDAVLSMRCLLALANAHGHWPDLFRMVLDGGYEYTKLLVLASVSDDALEMVLRRLDAFLFEASQHHARDLARLGAGIDEFAMDTAAILKHSGYRKELHRLIEVVFRHAPVFSRPVIDKITLELGRILVDSDMHQIATSVLIGLRLTTNDVAMKTEIDMWMAIIEFETGGSRTQTQAL